MTEINLATEKQAVLELKAALQQAKEEVQLAKEAAEAEQRAAYQLGVEETEVRLTEELSEVCRDYYSITWDKAINAAGIPADSTWRLPENVFYPPEIREVLADASEAFEQPVKSLRTLARSSSKVRMLRVRRAKARTKGKNPHLNPRIPLRRQLLRPRVTGLIQKPRMFLLLSQSRKKIPLLRLST